MNPKDIVIEDYNYVLPKEKIAKFPLQQRDKAKLLFYNGKEIKDEIFSRLPELLKENSLLVFNDTKVIYARLFFYKESGAKIEIFCLEPVQPMEIQEVFSQKEKVVFKCLIGNNKKWKDGLLEAKQKIKGIETKLFANRVGAEKDCWLVEFTWTGNQSFAEIMEMFGNIPLPPYLDRDSLEQDKQDYQTIYANYEGSVAAPTAGLHFTEETLEDLKKNNIHTDFVTLHVGAGTFKPVSSHNIGQHQMHTEKIFVSKSTIINLVKHLERDIVAVGTTSVRTLESLYWYGVELLEKGNIPMSIKQWQPYEKTTSISSKEALQTIINFLDATNQDYIEGETELIIVPSYKYRIINGIVTNFHQPKSTLLLLVSAFIGEKWKEIYDYALKHDYRFLSYGDACLFLPMME